MSTMSNYDDWVKRMLWVIYVETGADPDGDETWHCPVEDAFLYTARAVQQLREDYDASCAEWKEHR